MPAEVDGSSVVVLGGTSGIGREVARQVHALGAKVSIGSRSQIKLDTARADLGDVRAGTVDITDEDSVRSYFEEIDSVDHLVVSVGDMANGAVADVQLDAVERCLRGKIVGPLLAVRHAATKLSRSGSVVLFSGGAGFKPAPGLAATAAANAAVPALAKALALELAPVRVNTIVPGMIDTPLWSDLPENAKQDLFERTAQSLPTGRVGRAEDIAEMALALMTNAYTTGSTAFVDGGFLL